MSAATSIVVADPAPIFRIAVTRLLTEHGYEVIEAASTSELVTAAAEAQPEFALVDLDLPPDGGLAALARLTSLSSAKVVLWGEQVTAETVFDAVRGGAAGFLRKRISEEGLVRALDGVRTGEAPLGRALARELVEAVRRELGPARVEARASSLSHREREVLEFIAAGARNKQIGSLLDISEFTVKRHVQNILRKLDVSSRGAAATLYLATRHQAETSRQGVMS